MNPKSGFDCPICGPTVRCIDITHLELRNRDEMFGRIKKMKLYVPKELREQLMELYKEDPHNFTIKYKIIEYTIANTGIRDVSKFEEMSYNVKLGLIEIPEQTN